MVPTGRVGDGVKIDAPAKLTLSLRITGIRPDGYHLIDAEMVSLSIGDVLPFKHALDAARAVMADGAGFGDIASDVYWISGYTIGAVVVAFNASDVIISDATTITITIIIIVVTPSIVRVFIALIHPL